MNKIKLTDAEQVILKAGMSMLGSAVVGTAQGTYQYLTTQGNVSFNQAFGYALGSFVTLFSALMYVYIPAHHVEELAAAKDLYVQTQQELDALKQSQAVNGQPQVETPVQASQTQAGPLVHISLNGQPLANSVQAVGAGITALPAAFANVTNTPSNIPPTPLQGNRGLPLAPGNLGDASTTVTPMPAHLAALSPATSFVAFPDTVSPIPGYDPTKEDTMTHVALAQQRAAQAKS